MIMVVGISFNLIIIRVDQTAAHAGSSFVESRSAAPTSYPLHFMRSSLATPPARGMEVMISRDVNKVAEAVKHESFKPGEERSEWTVM